MCVAAKLRGLGLDEMVGATGPRFTPSCALGARARRVVERVKAADARGGTPCTAAFEAAPESHRRWHCFL